VKTMAAGFLLVLIPLVVAWVVAESARSRDEARRSRVELLRRLLQ